MAVTRRVMLFGGTGATALAQTQIHAPTQIKGLSSTGTPGNVELITLTRSPDLTWPLPANSYLISVYHNKTYVNGLQQAYALSPTGSLVFENEPTIPDAVQALIWRS
jgi:hypothetical protein